MSAGWKSFFITIILGVLVNNVFAMRCGNVIIDEEDYRDKLIQNCGEPTYSYKGGIFPRGGNVELLVYSNKDGSGMTYRVKLVNDQVVSIIGDRS